MLASERLKKIREILLEYKHININTLSSLLSASVTTIRRDLDVLEEEGFLNKVHGGATLVESDDNYEIGISSIEDPFYEEKAQIGQIAADLIDRNDVIFIGNGTTCQYLAKWLKTKKDLTIVTTDLCVANELISNNTIVLNMPGGDIDTMGSTSCMVGQSTVYNLSQMYFNKAFLGVSGISIDGGYTLTSRPQAEVYKKVLDVSNEIIVLADSSKFGKHSFAQFAPIERIKKILTDNNTDSYYKEFFFNNNYKLFISFDDLNKR